MRKKSDVAQAAIAARKLLQEIREKSRISGLIQRRALDRQPAMLPSFNSITLPLPDSARLINEQFGLIREDPSPGASVAIEAPRVICECIEVLLAAVRYKQDPDTAAAAAVRRLALLAAEIDHLHSELRRMAEQKRRG